MRSWREGVRDGVPEAVLLMGIARAMPPGTAHQILWAAASARGGPPEGTHRAGVCRDPDEEFMATANAVFFSRRRPTRETPELFTSAG